jgi:hypothetical protein
MAGCRLVAGLNFRKNESTWLVALEDGGYVANPIADFTTVDLMCGAEC